MAEIATSPDKLAFYLAVQAAIGEGNAQYTDDMFTTHDGRLLAVSRPSFADVVGDRPGHRRDPVALPDGGLPLRPHGRLTGRHAAAGERLDRQQGARARHPHRREDRGVRQRGQPAREQLHRRRRAGLPRQHRPGLHADRPPGRPRGLRHPQGRAVLPDRAHRRPVDRAPLGHGPRAGGGRLPGHGVGRPPDDAGARRAVRLPAGLVLPRLDRVRHPGGRPRRDDDLRRRADGRRRHAGGRPAEADDRAARELRARLGPPRHDDERRGDDALRRRHDGRLRRDRRPGDRGVRAGRRRREALLVDQRTRRRDVLGVGQRRGQGRRHRLRDRASRWRRSRSATTRSACARASSPTTSWRPGTPEVPFPR